MNPIAITSVGIVSPVGLCADSFWTILTQPRDLRSAWSRGDLSPYPVDKVIEIAPALWTSLALQGEDGAPRIAELARYAIEQALDGARLPARHGRIGCMLGTTTGGVEAMEALLGGAPVDPKAPAGGLRLDGAHLTPSHMNWNAPTSVLSTACSSGLLAPALACDLISLNEADVMIAGSVDTLLEYTVCGFSGMRLTTNEPGQPFAAGRKGIVLSEGCVSFCLEPLDMALNRGATIHGVIRGYGISCDAEHVTAPDVPGLVRAMAGALEHSGVMPAAIDAVFAHGTGTPANDAAETAALRAVFGDGTIPPLTAIKSVMGHSQAAAGSFSLLAALLAMKHGVLPSTAGLSEADPALGQVDVVLGRPRDWRGNNVMVNAFGFGGNNCVMVVSTLEAAQRACQEL